MTDEPAVDVLQPWTIKAVSNRTREKILTASRREQITVAQWLERRVDEWEADGSPVPVQDAGSHVVDAGDVARLIEAMRLLAHDAGVPIPPTLVRSGFGVVRRAFRQTAPRRLNGPS